MRVGGVASDAGRKYAPAGSIGLFRAPPQLIRWAIAIGSVRSRRAALTALRRFVLGKSYDQANEPLADRQVRQQQLDGIVQAATGRVVAHVAGQSPALHSHFFYGAFGIHPGHLVAWYLFQSDADWEAAKQSGLTSVIDLLTRAELEAGGYPQEGIPLMLVGFVSDETIQREAATVGTVSN